MGVTEKADTAAVRPALVPDTMVSPAGLRGVPAAVPPEAAEEEIGIDDLDGDTVPPSSPPPSPAGPAGSPSRIRLKTEVDWTIEYLQADKKEFTFSYNHQYIVLGLAPHPKIMFQFELTEAVYWELKYAFDPATAFKIGKIAVPFGPLFLHSLLGGIVEKPTSGGGHRSIMVPEVWAEYGVGLDRTLVDRTRLTVNSRFWVTNGLQGQVKSADRTVDFTSEPKNRDNNLDKAVGVRLENTWMAKYGLNFSFYTAKWAEDCLRTDGRLAQDFYKGDRVYIWNGEVSLGYNSLPYTFVKDLSFLYQFALLRTCSTQRTAAVDNRVPWHNKSADMFQVRYNRFKKWCVVQFRYGTYDDNRDFDSSQDLINYNVALTFPVAPGIQVIPMYMWNREKVNEKQDDFFFIKIYVQL